MNHIFDSFPFPAPEETLPGKNKEVKKVATALGLPLIISLDEPSSYRWMVPPQMSSTSDFCIFVFEGNCRWSRAGTGGKGWIPQPAQAEPGHGQPHHSLLGLDGENFQKLFGIVYRYFEPDP